MSNVAAPERVVYSEQPPRTGQLISVTVYSVSELLNASGQEIDLLADNPDGSWRQSNALVTLYDGMRYYAHAPERLRSSPQHEGIIIHVEDSLALGQLISVPIDEPPPIRVGAIWDCLESISPVREVLVRRPRDVVVFQRNPGEQSDEELAIRSLTRYEGYDNMDRDFMEHPAFKKPAYSLAVAKMLESMNGPQKR